MGEVRPTLRLGAPIMAGMVSQLLMGLVDTLMVGRIGVTELAAASFVLLLVHPPVTFGLGLLSAVAILTSQAFGAKRTGDAGEALRNGLLLSVLAGIVVALGCHAIQPFLHSFGQEPEVVEECRAYLLIFGWSTIPGLIAHAAKQFSEALNRAWIPNAIMLGAVALNAFLNWILIYGNLGAPRMGLEGAGWATLIARIVMAVVMIVYILRAGDLREYLPSRWFAATRLSAFKRILRLGGPVGAQHVLEVSAFAFAALMMGWISKAALAAHQIAITCAATSFMFMVGLGMAVCIRVGHAWGAGRLRRTRRIGFVGVALAASGMVCFGIVFMAARHPIARVFVTDPEVVRLAAQMFIVAALFQVADGVQVTAISALRGISDVKTPAMVAILAYWVVAIPLGYGLAFWAGMGAIGIWIALAIGIAIAAFFLVWRFHHQSRKQPARRADRLVFGLGTAGGQVAD